MTYGVLLFTTVLTQAEPRLPSASLANNATEKKGRRELYGGIVTNQTVTVAGHDFYQRFVAAWRDREMSERFAISVHELPSPRLGSRVWIEYAQRRIFQAHLPARRAAIGTVSERAAEVAYQMLVDAEAERLLFKDPDLGSDKLTGASTSFEVGK